MSCFTSGLQEGISILKFFFETFVLKPNELSILLVSLDEIGIPITFLNLLLSISIIRLFIFALPTKENLLASPPQILMIRPVANSRPSLIEFGSIPLSNLYFASVSMSRVLAVFLTEDG